MEKEQFWMFLLGWLATSAPLLVELLKALVPVLALCVAGYALYAVSGKNRRKDGHD
jgi:hypothetical protein